MPRRRQQFLRVAIAVPLRRGFDYLPPGGDAQAMPAPGTRVRVPFGKTGMSTGLVLEAAAESGVAAAKLKTIAATLDARPLYDRAHLALLQWASAYYHHPIGEVIFSTMPAVLRRGRPAVRVEPRIWKVTDAGRSTDPHGLERAPRQLQALLRLQQSPEGIAAEVLRQEGLLPVLRKLADKGLAQECAAAAEPVRGGVRHGGIRLNPDQQAAVEAACADPDTFRTVLLKGVTGSGKTEVYIEIIGRVLARGLQALVLVPEIGLTPQLVRRFQERLDCPIGVLHSGLADGERLRVWLAAAAGDIPVLLGTRSAVWTPLRRTGVIIIDEEHDQSYKQQEGFRYSARDVAIMRARNSGVAVVLGSATPCMETLHNAASGRYVQAVLQHRAAATRPPQLGIIDMRARSMQDALSTRLLTAIEEELQRRRQVLLFLNKRGYSPVIMCHACGWTAQCPRCNVPMTFHKHSTRLCCHHCGRRTHLPGECRDCRSGEILQIGHGTERLEETLAGRFPQARILRIDRDSTRRKDAMRDMVNTITAGAADILVGTQMIAKGHHFPNLDLVGIIDADRGLFSADFRASEHMAQLITQVSGRAGRTTDSGRVLIQTHHPDHPLLQSLIRHGYDAFAAELLDERRQAGLPPFSHLALLRAEDYKAERATAFLEQAGGLLAGKGSGVEVYGPVPAPMEKKAGRSRFQLLLQSTHRNRLQRLLEPWSRELEQLPAAKLVRWSLDVDPQDMM